MKNKRETALATGYKNGDNTLTVLYHTVIEPADITKPAATSAGCVETDSEGNLIGYAVVYENDGIIPNLSIQFESAPKMAEFISGMMGISEIHNIHNNDGKSVYGVVTRGADGNAITHNWREFFKLTERELSYNMGRACKFLVDCGIMKGPTADSKLGKLLSSRRKKRDMGRL